MTFPPQQGQPGPHRQDPYGQQGHLGQFGQQPGHYGQQAGQFGQRPGYPGGPPKKKAGLIIAIVVAVLVLAGGVTALLVLTGDDGPSNTASEETTGQQAPPQAGSEEPPGTDGGEPSAGGSVEDLQAAGDAYVEAIMAKDEAAATELTCEGSSPGVLYESVIKYGDGTVVTAGAAEVRGGNGSVEISFGSTKQPPLPFSFTDGKWCVGV